MYHMIRVSPILLFCWQNHLPLLGKQHDSVYIAKTETERLFPLCTVAKKSLSICFPNHVSITDRVSFAEKGVDNCRQLRCNLVGWRYWHTTIPTIHFFVYLEGLVMNFKALRTIIGSVLIHISIGTVYTAANMITYIISYLHVLKEQAVCAFCVVSLVEYHFQHGWLAVRHQYYGSGVFDDDCRIDRGVDWFSQDDHAGMFAV